MKASSWLKSFSSRAGRRQRGEFRNRRAFLLTESLEERVVLSSFTVTDNSDLVTDSGSLRYAITHVDASADDSNTITINPILTGGQTITLGSALPSITQNVSIVGPGASIVSVSGNNLFQVFNIAVGSTVSISGLTITGGSANSGGGIYNVGALSVTNCTVSNNWATGSNPDGCGGGIDDEGTLTVTGSTLVDNKAAYGGGIFNSGVGPLIVTDSLLNGNSAGVDGGGILGQGTLIITNSTLTDNSALLYGGGIYNHDYLTVTNSTLTLNSAHWGGGIVNFWSATLNNTIVANSLSGGDLSPGPFSTEFDGENNLINDGTGADPKLIGTINADPNLGPLAYNGGPTETFALLAGSPALNAGRTDLAVDAQGNPLLYDQRGAGFPRVVGSAVDIGAFEFAETTSEVVTTGADVVDPTDGLTSLREAVNLANATAGAHTITFAPGLTAVTLTQDQLTLNSDVTIDGGANGSRVTISRSTDAGTLPFRIFAVSPFATVALDNLVITGGYFPSGSGGGIDNAGSLKVSSCFVSNNSAASGGAIHNSGALTVTSTSFDNDSAFNGSGGAIDNAGTLKVTSSTVSHDTAASGGGGIYNDHGMVTVTSGTLSYDTAEAGGAIYSFGGTVTLESGSTLSNNTAASGGAISNYSGTVTVTSGTLSNNSATGFGGAIANIGGALTVESSSVLSDNSAGTEGGGVYNNGGILMVLSSRLSTNSAIDSGGGIYSTGGAVTVTGSTIASNSVPSGNGGGIYGENAALTVSNTILQGNSALDGGGIDNESGTLTVSTDSSLNNNTAQSGGGILNELGTVDVTSGTFTNNLALRGSGGGIYSDHGTVTITIGQFDNNSAVSDSQYVPASGGAIYTMVEK